jgi:micrococcal nuclease
VLVSFTLVLAPASGAESTASSGTVASVYDGDTLSLTDGRRVRLLQIDTPELGTGECYSRASRKVLASLMPVGARVTLEADSRLDTVDRYGRLLRYVHRGPLNANVLMVRAGAAAPYFYGGDVGKYALRLLADAQKAKRAKRGLWGACRARCSTRLGRSTPGSAVRRPRCRPERQVRPELLRRVLPPYPPDLDYADLRAAGLAPVRSIGSDPHGLDGDHDGIGCE